MDLSQPFQSLFPTVDSAVLSVLTQATKPRTGRELAKLADRSQSGTLRVLERLVEHGLVLREDAGRAHVYRLNDEHLAAGPVAMLAEMRSILLGRVRNAVAEWDPAPLHLSVFGSAARGDGSVHSDIDVFVVRPRPIDEEDEAWRSQVDALATSIHAWSGNRAGISELGEDELDLLRHERPPIVSELERDAVQIYGPPVRQLLQDRR